MQDVGYTLLFIYIMLTIVLAPLALRHDSQQQ
jgi:hypothetical protein